MQKSWLLKGALIILLITVIVESLWLFTTNQNNPVAVIDNVNITEKEFIKQLKGIYGKEVLNEMINKKIIKLTAEKYEIKTSKEEIDREYSELREGYDTEEDFIGFLQEEMGWSKEQLLNYIEYNLLWEEIAVRDINVSEEQIKQYFEENRSAYIIPERIHLQQIIVNTEDEAFQVIDELENGSDFNTLAKERSIDPLTSGNGGDLGFITLDDPSIDPSILEVANTLSINEYTTVALEEGFGIIRVIAKKEEVQYSLEEVQDQIRREIALSQVNSLPQVLEQLKKELNVKILDPQLRNDEPLS